MRIQRLSIFFAGICGALLLLGGAPDAQAGDIRIASPGAYINQEGDGLFPGESQAPYRYQQVFPAEDFAALGNQPHWIVGFAPRPDQSVTNARTARIPDNEVRLSTTERGPDNLSVQFGDNHGSDVKRFYRGPLTMVADVAAQGPGPRDFYRPDFSAGVTPFLYDPSQGNLLFDFIAWQGESPSNLADQFPGTTVVGDPSATRGELQSGAAIFQFTFVPDLETPMSWNVDAGGNWSLSANWGGSAPNWPGARAVLGSAINAPRTVIVNNPVTIGRLDFDNVNAYTITGSRTLTLDANSGDAQINVAKGSHTISAPVRLLDNATISVTPAAGNLALSGSLNFSGKTVAKVGAGTLSLNTIRAEGLSIDGGMVSVAPNGTDFATSVLRTLSIAGTPSAPEARLDLTNNAMVIDYAGTNPAATVRQQIVTGRGGAGLGATWNGMGISSSAAASADADTRSIGYADNSVMPLGAVTNFRGEAVDATSILIAYTRTCDANLDGVVNDDDVTIVGASYAPGVPQPSWALGDFDYNGFVDDDDVTLLGAFYDPSAPPLNSLAAPAAAGTTGAVAAVPEPSTLASLIATTAALLFSRRLRPTLHHTLRLRRRPL